MNKLLCFAVAVICSPAFANNCSGEFTWQGAGSNPVDIDAGKVVIGEPDNPGMHTTDTFDYGVVVRGEIILELDDGKTVHLRQGDCWVQRGTRHRWRNPLSEPCLIAAVLIGAQRTTG